MLLTLVYIVLAMFGLCVALILYLNIAELFEIWFDDGDGE